MKKLLLSSLLFFCIALMNAQTVNSVTVIPPSPTTNDQIKIVANTTFGWNCISKTITVNVVGNQIQIYIQKCLGLLSILCTENDTANVGLLPAGTYTIYVFLSYAQANPTCINYTPPMPTTSFTTFTVSQFMGVTEAKNNFSLNVFPNPSSGNVYFKYNVSQNAQLEIYNIVGEKIKSYTLISGSNEVVIKDGELKSGIYFAKVITGNKETTVQKFTIIE